MGSLYSPMNLQHFLLPRISIFSRYNTVSFVFNFVTCLSLSQEQLWKIDVLRIVEFALQISLMYICSYFPWLLYLPIRFFYYPYSLTRGPPYSPTGGLVLDTDGTSIHSHRWYCHHPRLVSLLAKRWSHIWFVWTTGVTVFTTGSPRTHRPWFLKNPVLTTDKKVFRSSTAKKIFFFLEILEYECH